MASCPSKGVVAATVALASAFVVLLLEGRRRGQERAYDDEIARLAAERRERERADTVESGAVMKHVDVYELKGEYYQVLGHAWDHETKDFKVVYRPLYHCEAKHERFEAHTLAVSHFSRWDEKFTKVTDLTTIDPKAAALLLEGPFTHDPLWTYASRTSPSTGNTSGLGTRRHQ